MSRTTPGRAGAALAVALVAAGLVVAGASPASAHAICDKASPAHGATIDQAPAEVGCEFTEPLVPVQSKLEVYDACNRRVDDGNVRVVGFRMTVGMAQRVPGQFTAVYHTLSGKDGHEFVDYWVFTVRGDAPCKPGATAKPTPAKTPGGSPTRPPSVAPTVTPSPGSTTAPPSEPAGSPTAAPPGQAFRPPPGLVLTPTAGKRIAAPMTLMFLGLVPLGAAPALLVRRAKRSRG